MKKILLLALICFSTVCTFAATGNQYVVNDQQVEQLFSNSVDASLTALSDQTMMNATGGLAAHGAQFRSSDKTFVAAILLDFFLGGLGIHRLYLGTATLTWVGYILTFCGIFGIVPLVDFIVLIVHNDDISPYVDNTKFFMWAGNA
ncbi:MAG TPA: TM2 domain-containing protein [Puia sp.]|nr:TM2 domain-containing protein [Puia sp.]